MSALLEFKDFYPNLHMTLEESFKIFSWKVSDATNAGPLLVAESRLGEKGVGLMLFFSTLASWLYGSLDVITAVLTGLSFLSFW